MNPYTMIILGIILAVGGIFGGIMIKEGIDKLKHQFAINQSKSTPSENNYITERVSKQKIAKIKINRIIDDANAWVQERIEQNRPETDKLISQFNARGVIHSGMHVAAHIDRVNLLLKNINDYIKDMNRKIEDELLSLGEEKFETAVWLKDEFVKYQGFVKFSETAKNNLKSFNNEVCLRFADKPTFENILKSHPYKE